MTPAAKSIVDWDGIDTVLVDMDGTLLDLNFDNLFWREIVPQRYARLRGMSVSAAQQSLAPRFEAKVGTLEWYCLDHWTRDLGMDLKSAEARAPRAHSVPARRAGVSRERARSRQTSFDRHQRASRYVCREGRAHRHRSARRQRRVLARFLGAEGKRRRSGARSSVTSRSTLNRTLLLEDSLAVLAAARAYGVRHTVAIRRPDSQLPPRAIAGVLRRSTGCSSSCEPASARERYLGLACARRGGRPRGGPLGRRPPRPPGCDRGCRGAFGSELTSAL